MVTIVTRAGKGSPLTNTEIDANFTNLKVAVEALTAALAADVRAGTDAAKFVTSGALMDAAALVTLTDAATITPDFGAGFNFVLTLGGNRALATPTNLKIGQSGVIIVKQDATGSRTLTPTTAWKFPGASMTLSTTANAVDLISYFVEIAAGTPTIRCGLMKAFA